MEPMIKHARFTWLLSVLFLALLVFLTFMQVNAPAQMPPWFKTKGFDEYRYDIFMGHMNTFYRKLKGCPPTGYPPAITCSEGNTMFDVKEWKILTDQAQTLFANQE